MKPTSAMLLASAFVVVSSCSTESTDLPEVTRVEIASPNAGLIRSADGNFEVEFQLGALSSSAEVTIRTDRSRLVTTWEMIESLPRYEVRISPCVSARPELIQVRHRVPESLGWDGRLTLARTTSSEVEHLLLTTMQDDWVRNDGAVACDDAGDDGEGVLFELATSLRSECTLPPNVACAPCAPCEALDWACAQRREWVCVAEACIPFVGAETLSCDEVHLEGWDDAPGTGVAFVVDNLQVMGQGLGLDLDGACRAPGDCTDNALWPLGQVATSMIRSGLLSGETLLLFELAGLNEPFAGDDDLFTLKSYGVRDADDPFFPANNFSVPRGEESCCEFDLSPQSVAGVPPQARSRTLAQARRGQLSTLSPIWMQFTLTVGVPPHPEIRIMQTRLSARIPSSLDRISDGILGGAVSITWLASTENPYCKTFNTLCPQQLAYSTFIDLMAGISQPDIDIDGDGLERLEVGADGRVARCFDGDGSIVPPLVPGSPWTCALTPRMADGYSIAFTFTAVRATIVGIGN